MYLGRFKSAGDGSAGRDGREAVGSIKLPASKSLNDKR